MQDRIALRSLFFSLAVVYLVLMVFTGHWPWEGNSYNSYALQAQAWLQGHLDLGINYTHLEIAVFQGKYFVSFPPLPSVLLLPFVLFFGPNHTPDNLIALIAAFASAWFAYKIARQLGRRPQDALFWSLFLVVGGNFLFVSLCGWVWFIAQSLSFAFCLMAIHFALTPRFRDGIFALGLWACAVGCRPFQILYLPILIIIMVDKLGPGWKGKLKSLLWLPLPAAICTGYALLNYFRFGSALQFGHDYLPEFTAAPHGQFSWHYLADNWGRMLLPPGFNGGIMQFPSFDGFAFYVASPLFIAFIICLVLRFRSGIKASITAQYLLPGLFLVHLLLFCFHKTLGGWHFGNRYTIDMLPFVFLGILWLRANHSENRNWGPVFQALFWLGLLLNVAGTIVVTLDLLKHNA